MSQVAIVTDSTADFPPGEAEKFGIRIVDKSTPEAFLKAYEQVGGKTGKIIVIVAPEKIAGTIFAARRPKERLPDFDIRVIDSHSVSFGQGFLVVEAAKMAKNRNGLDTVELEINRLIRKIRIYGLLGRRLGDPVIAIKDSEVKQLKRIWMRGKAIPKLIEIMKKEGEMVRLGVFYASAQDLAEEVAKKLKDDYSGFEISVAQLNPAIRAHFDLLGLVGVCGLLK